MHIYIYQHINIHTEKKGIEIRTDRTQSETGWAERERGREGKRERERELELVIEWMMSEQASKRLRVLFA